MRRRAAWCGLFGLGMMLVGSSSESAPVVFEGELGWGMRMYPGSVQGNNAETTLGGELVVRGRNAGVRWLVSPRLWVDVADPDRLRWIPRQAWAEVQSGPVRLRLGRDTITWGSSDSYRPTDVVGATDPGFNFTDNAKRGEWMVSATASRENLGLEAVLLPILEPVDFPGFRSPWSIQAAVRRVGLPGDQVRLLEDHLTPSDMGEASVGARARFTAASTDFYLVGFYGLDRTPVLYADDNCDGDPDCFPTQADVSDLYAPLRLIGAEVQSAFGDLVARVEFSYRDQHTDDAEFAARTSQLAATSTQFTVGFERVWSGVLGEGSVVVGVEYLRDDAAQNPSVLLFRPFQNDLAVAVSWNPNDFAGSLVELGWVQDLDRAESFATVRLQRRLTPELLVVLGGDLIRGPTPKSLPEAANPFYLYSVNDRLVLELRYGF